jgi:glycosyltransferase involved in cell wall biosynthesis
MQPLRIGVNALYLIPGGVGGTEIYLRSLLAALAEIDKENKYIVLTNRETSGDLVPAAANFQWLPQSIDASNRPARLIWEQTALPVTAVRCRLDVLFNPGFTAPVICPCSQVTVFHDLQHKRHPEHFRRLDLPFWRFFLYWSAVLSDRLIAVSESTRKDLLELYPLEPRRVHVVAHGVDQHFFEIGTRRRPEPLILCVSTLHPHKNLHRLIRAFGAFRKERPEYRLVIAGLRGFFARQLEEIAGEGVELTGWIPRDDLYSLFERASAFVYPSTFEGFGMPVLEAMAAGLPLACSAIEPVQTVAGGAACLFDPSSDDALLSALGRVTAQTGNPAGIARARQFSWQASAQATLAVLRAAADSG